MFNKWSSSSENEARWSFGGKSSVFLEDLVFGLEGVSTLILRVDPSSIAVHFTCRLFSLVKILLPEKDSVLELIISTVLQSP